MLTSELYNESSDKFDSKQLEIVVWRFVIRFGWITKIL